jgi:hypothetical protein
LALLMGIRGGKKLPPLSAQGTRVAFGTLTFLLWYAAMLAAMSVLAMLTVRSFREVGSTVVSLLAITGLLWGVRRLVRQVFVPAGPPVPALGSANRSKKH